MSLRPLFCAMALLAASPAWADTTPEQAAALQGQLHDWLQGVIGTVVYLPPLPIQFVPEGDHFRMQTAIGGTIPGSGITIEAAAPWTGTVRPLEGNRYAIDNLKLPSPMTIINDGGPPEMHWTVGIALDGQENHAILDPTLATTSSYDGSFTGLVETIETPQGKANIKIARGSTHQTSQPKADGRQSIVFETALEKLDSVQPTKEGVPIHVGIAKMLQTGHADGFGFAQFGTMIRVATALGQMAGPEQTKPKAAHPMTPAQKKQLRMMADAMGALLTGVELDQTIEGLRFETGAIGGSIAKMSVGMGFGAPKGEMEAHMRLAIDGIDSPQIPPGAFAALVPKHLALSPRVSGIPKAAAMRLLNEAIENGDGDQSEVQAEAMALLDKSPVTVGIDDLAIDVGVAQLTGSGEVDVSSPTDVSGEAELRMTGIDALLKQLGSAPETKMAVPVLIFLKGIGTQDDQETVWTVKYEDDKVTVNGTDLSDMIPKSK